MAIYTQSQVKALTAAIILAFTSTDISSFKNTFVDPRTGASSIASIKIRQLDFIEKHINQRLLVPSLTNKYYIKASSFNNTKSMKQLFPLFMSLLTEYQLKRLTVNQCAELSDKQSMELTSAQIVLLNKEQLAAINITNRDTAIYLDDRLNQSIKQNNIFYFQLLILTLDFLNNLPGAAGIIKRLSPEQIVKFKSLEALFSFAVGFYRSSDFTNSSDMGKFYSWQVPLLTIDQIKDLTSTQIQAMNEMQVQALTNEQIEALNETQVQALTDEQIGWFTRVQMESVPIEYLTTPKILSINKSQMLGVTLARQLMLNIYTLIRIKGGGGAPRDPPAPTD